MTYDLWRQRGALWYHESRLNIEEGDKKNMRGFQTHITGEQLAICGMFCIGSLVVGYLFFDIEDLSFFEFLLFSFLVPFCFFLLGNLTRDDE